MGFWLATGPLQSGPGNHAVSRRILDEIFYRASSALCSQSQAAIFCKCTRINQVRNILTGCPLSDLPPFSYCIWMCRIFEYLVPLNYISKVRTDVVQINSFFFLSFNIYRVTHLYVCQRMSLVNRITDADIQLA